jgi:hypothetical protein
MPSGRFCMISRFLSCVIHTLTSNSNGTGAGNVVKWDI